MAVVIRLKRLGRAHRPFYRIEAIEKRNARGGRSLETVGFYDPMANTEDRRVKVKLERMQFWLDRGARPSQTVTTFLRKMDVNWGVKKKSRKALARKRRKSADRKAG